MSATRTGTASVLIGGLLMAVNAGVGALDTVIVRLASTEVHAFEIAFFRNAFSLLVLLPFLLVRSNLSLRTPYWPVHALRAVLKLAALIAFFLAVTQLPLAVATAIAFTTPVFAAIGSMLFLGEPVRIGRIAGVMAGLCGVLIILRPGAIAFDTGIVLALLAAIGLAGVALLMKLSSGREPADRIVWFNLVLTVPIALIVCLPVWTTPSPFVLGILALQGALGALAQFSFARALSMADASVLMPVDFIRLPLAALFGQFLFAEQPDALVFVGGAVIFASAIVLLHQERRPAIVLPTAEGKS
ncbi:DMT family transporter [Marinivivus vitaminiproducens]|uniref:DMT family transporter n=1 Tax=Marinivivus vitaminiproducens TaxID=3035935 RepID=UPI0027A9727C|nr:DMT family transporter [Geminicoccaceae bacterium SCSIO 64248]